MFQIFKNILIFLFVAQAAIFCLLGIAIGFIAGRESRQEKTAPKAEKKNSKMDVHIHTN